MSKIVDYIFERLDELIIQKKEKMLEFEKQDNKLHLIEINGRLLELFETIIAMHRIEHTLSKDQLNILNEKIRWNMNNSYIPKPETWS